jgi:hypothetical protein
VNSNIHKKVFDAIEYTRQKGNTTALVKAALETNGVLIVFNNEIAKRLKSQYKKLNVESLSSFHTKIIGNRVPLFFDNSAIAAICKINEKENTIPKHVEVDVETPGIL